MLRVVVERFTVGGESAVGNFLSASLRLRGENSFDGQLRPFPLDERFFQRCPVGADAAFGSDLSQAVGLGWHR